MISPRQIELSERYPWPTRKCSLAHRTGLRAGFYRRAATLRVRGCSESGAVAAAGSGTVSQQGMVDVTVTGLVIPALGNTNPVALFKATVSCLGPSGVTNVSTANFAASATGDAHIQAVIDLPHPCKQPIIFVAAATGQWFAESNPDTQP
jgi:hypothetical protein